MALADLADLEETLDSEVSKLKVLSAGMKSV